MPLFGLRAAGLLVVILLHSAAVATESGGSAQVYQYRVSWNGIPAAQATVTLADAAPSQPAITRVRVSMRTNDFVDLFWSLRAESWAEIDARTLRPLFFEYDRRINGRPEATSVEAEDNGLLTGRYSRPGRYHLIEVNEADTLDPITAALRAWRSLPAVGGTQRYDVFTGEARYRIELHRHSSETVTVPAGRFTAARIEPAIWRLDENRPDKRVRRVTLWLADVAPHTLLRVRSEVFIGALYLDLTNWEQGHSTDAAQSSITQAEAQLQ